MLDPRDAALQGSLPCVVVPKFGVLLPMPSDHRGMRLLVARGGLYVQIQLDWLRATVCIQPLACRPPLPYGELRESICFTFGVIPVALLEAFIAAGRAALPNEIAGALVYSRSTGSLRLVLHEAIATGPARVHYRLPRLASHECLAVDLHTHGHLRADWSATDDEDDQGIKVAGVFGDLDQPGHESPSAAFRLVVNGFFKDLPHPWIKRRTANEIGAVDPSTTWPTLDALGFRSLEDAAWST